MVLKRRFSDLRFSILTILLGGRKTVNDISLKTGINWKTVDNHLIFLTGKGFVEKIFDSPYVKIFEISEHGREYVTRQHKDVK
ncbi:MAG: ArsR family transcriptional regulator [Nanoarchaeota archaeon]